MTNVLLAPGLAWQIFLKKTEVELELLIETDILLMVKQGIKDGMCHAVHQHANSTTITWKIMTRGKNLLIICTAMWTTCMDGQFAKVTNRCFGIEKK